MHLQALEYPFDGEALLRKKRALRRELAAQPGLVEKKVAIVSGTTVGEVKNMLELFLLNSGIRPTFWEGPYGLYYESIAFDDGSLAAFAPDVIYIHTSVHNLQNLPVPADSAAAAEEKFAAEAARWQGLWQAAARFGCPVVQNNFELPDVRVLGNFDAVAAAGRVRFVRRMNALVADWAAQHANFYVHDLCWLSASEGLSRWCEPAAWYAYKYACAVPYIPTLAHSVACIIKALFGKNKKAIATDLDNTLWGGVVGDDGPEALAMGSETPAGMAHTALQQYLKDLSGAGVLLNVCSKNEDDAARAGLRQPAATLREEDFVCFCANWQPKDANLAAMAKQLNLLPESFVFLDDNPAERALVRQSLPGVAVPELAGPESYVRTLDRAGYFEAVGLSADDKKRAQMYRENALRSAASASFSNYGEYLRSLTMRAEIGPFRPGQLGRITQLINKTNQFNLTTRRYTEAEVDACMQDAGCITLAGRLEDKFGDNGLVSALIGRVQGSAVHIELWVMSCRVFKREFELAMFDALVAACRARGVHTIVGAYLPTAKNAPVKGLYPSLGFAAAGETPQRAEYRYDIPAAYAPQCRCIAVNNTTPPKEETP